MVNSSSSYLPVFAGEVFVLIRAGQLVVGQAKVEEGWGCATAEGYHTCKVVSAQLQNLCVVRIWLRFKGPVRTRVGIRV